MQQSNSSVWPQSTIAYKGNVFANGIPAGPKDRNYYVGGYMDINDANNTITGGVYPYGYLVSSIFATPNLWAQGIPSASYGAVGILVASEAEMQNEPFKSGGYLLGEPATAMVDGFVRYNTWAKLNTPTPIDPVKGCAVVYDKTLGDISFTAQATTTTGNYVKLGAAGTIPGATVISVDPPGGLTGTGTSVLIHFTIQ